MVAKIECGLVSVPLRYDRVGGRQIRVAYARIHSRAGGGGRPLVVLGGGPGQSVIDLLPAFVTPGSSLARLSAGRDVVLVDQRGAGHARPSLSCAGELGRVAPQVVASKAIVTALTRCVQRLRAGGLDLAGFNTVNNARDLDRVRQALGYQQVDLFGTSYGARLALEALRGDPGWVHAAVLSSPVPAEANFVSDGATSYANALSRTFQLCAADRSCARRYPRLAANFALSLQRLQQAPVQVTVEWPIIRRVTLNAATVASTVFALYYSPVGIQLIPRLLSALADRDYQAVAELVNAASSVNPDNAVTLGMTFSFVCQEQAATSSSAILSKNAAGLPLAGRLVAHTNLLIGTPLFNVCRAWHLPKAPAVTFTPVSSSIPTLVVTGQLDQITPPRYGRMIRHNLQHGHLINVPAIGHSPLLGSGACGITVLLAFLDQPNEPTNSTCLSNRTPSFR